MLKFTYSIKASDNHIELLDYLIPPHVKIM